MKILHFISIAFILIGFSPIFAQDSLVSIRLDTIVENKPSLDSTAVVVYDTISKSRWKIAKEDALLAFGGVKHAYSAPLHWEKGDWLALGGIAAGTGIMLLSDEETSRYFTNQKESAPQVLKQFGWYSGSPQNNYMFTGAVYLYGLFADDKAFRKTGVLLISSASAAGIIQTISKNVVGRARPTAGVGSATFRPFSKESHYHSFPSGHSILMFTTAYGLSKQFSNPWVKGSLWAAGLIAPVSRLWEGAHWLSDVGLGIALSVVTVESINKYLERTPQYKDPYKQRTSIKWNLSFGSNKIGVVGTF